MKELFLYHASKIIGEPVGKKFLLAVSGGVDSMVLCYLFEEWKVPYAIAHVNFKLRGTESDEDEKFIREFALKKEIPFFFHAADTKTFVENNKVSIQMAARDIRYAFLKDTAKNNGYDYIVTAHHLNDQAETFFINLSRGTGIDGLCGMKDLDNNLFRPLLNFSKEEILQFAQLLKIPFREDSSNNEDKYTRNKIRHHLIPFMQELNPSFIQVFGKNMVILKNVREIHNTVIRKYKKELLKKTEYGFEIELEHILKLDLPSHILFELLQPFHFNLDIAESIIRNSHDESGKRFFSATHRIIISRGIIIITKLLPNELETYLLEDYKQNISEPISLQFTETTVEEKINFDPHFAYFDLDKIKKPLYLRKWHKGDSFFPLGMKGKKKLSDFFIDLKMSLVEKENTWLLTSEDQIIWVIGRRIDDRFKVTNSTKSVLKIEWLV